MNINERNGLDIVIDKYLLIVFIGRVCILNIFILIEIILEIFFSFMIIFKKIVILVFNCLWYW